MSGGVGSATFGLVAAAARDVLQAAMPDASVYDYAPVQGFNKFPVVFFVPPDFVRKEAGEPESQLGSVDLNLTFTLMAFVLDNATGEGGRNAEDEAAQFMGRIIGVIDNDPTLGGVVLIESVVSEGQFQRMQIATENVSGGSPVVGYEARLDVQTLIGQ